MATQQATDEADIRQRIDNAVAAVRAMDLEAVMTFYAPDIVSFDIAPPLQHIGAAAKRKAWTEAFTAYQPPIGYEVRDLTITLNDEIAFGHSINRISGTLKNGATTNFWLRWTTCFRKIEGNWLLAHEQVSVPIDLATGAALLNLEPGSFGDHQLGPTHGTSHPRQRWTTSGASSAPGHRPTSGPPPSDTSASATSIC